ncbi:MAG TPA: mechanosensitive ion channel family protein, partial [Paracoccaceae bacterium]|nr:mechanosensitive ion channel family protein [Paracoccaceae bacterium]
MTPETLGVTPDLGADAADWRILITLGFVLAVMLVRWGIVRLIRSRTSLPAEIQRWWVTLTRNSFNVLAVLGVIVIWAPEIEYFALSITAFAVALVIATKELILCVSGALWRGVARPFGIGDWVQIGTHFGEVIDESFLATVLQEIDQSECRYSGRTVAVPNSILLAAPVI